MTRFYDPKNDIAFKKLFTTLENKSLLISFLNTALKREGNDIIEDVEIIPTELLPDFPGSKNSLIDLRCRDKKNFQYIVEVQNKSLSYFVQRVQYYASKAYGNQLSEGDSYLELRPVILLSILKGKIFSDNVHYINYHHTLEIGTNQNLLKDISYAFVELSKFNKKEAELKSLEDYWLHMFKEASQESEIPENAPLEIKQAYEVLEQYRWSAVEKEAYERATIAAMDEKDALMTAREEGIEEEKIASADRMLDDNEPVEKIARQLDLPIERVLERKAEQENIKK